MENLHVAMQALDGLRRELIRGAVIREARIARERDADYEHIQFVATFADRRTWRWILTRDELEMDGLAPFIMRIQREARLMAAQFEGPTGAARDAQAWQAEEFTRNARIAMQLTEMHFQQLRAALPMRSRVNTPAHRKARELFIKTAGMEAYTELNEGRAWPVVGSLGTDYCMTKRASFCITRVGDGVEFCAVVPGVPIWDHLLGVKLMVEHDEPRFLATANSSIGARLLNSIINNPRNWNAQGGRL